LEILRNVCISIFCMFALSLHVESTDSMIPWVVVNYKKLFLADKHYQHNASEVQEGTVKTVDPKTWGPKDPKYLTGNQL